MKEDYSIDYSTFDSLVERQIQGSADALLHVTPYYNKASQQGLFLHFFVLSNLIPKETHDICASFFEGNSEESDNLQLKYLELIEALFSDVNPIPVKQAMRMMGYSVGPSRLPLCDMDSTMAEKLYTTLQSYGLLQDAKKEIRRGT